MYNLTLQVADMSGDGLTSTASAIITLEDVNDNAPGFTRAEVPPPPPYHQPRQAALPSPGPEGPGLRGGLRLVLWSRHPAQGAQRPELGATEMVLVSSKPSEGVRRGALGEAAQTSPFPPNVCAVEPTERAHGASGGGG